MVCAVAPHHQAHRRRKQRKRQQQGFNLVGDLHGVGPSCLNTCRVMARSICLCCTTTTHSCRSPRCPALATSSAGWSAIAPGNHHGPERLGVHQLPVHLQRVRGTGPIQGAGGTLVFHLDSAVATYSARPSHRQLIWIQLHCTAYLEEADTCRPRHSPWNARSQLEFPVFRQHRHGLRGGDQVEKHHRLIGQVGLRNEGKRHAGGSSGVAAAIAVCTSTAAPSMSRSRLNWV